jgi:plastocyanin
MYSDRMLAIRSFVLLAVCASVASLGVTGHADAANIRGVVVMTGTVVPKKLPVTIDQYVCGKEKVGEDLPVGPQGGVKNVVVWLQTPPPGATWPSAPVKVEMDQKSCTFAPRVVLVPAGGTVEFLNSDRLLHNLHSASRENPTFNRTQPRGRVIPVTFSKPEFVQVNCDLHSWMRAWVVVADHPYYALSNDAGEFVLPNVPPGKYVLQIWQETLGITSRDVTVGADDARVTVELKAPR